MGSRRQAREHALQALYQCDCLQDWSNQAVELYFECFHSDPDSAPTVTEGEVPHQFARTLISGVLANLDAIDGCISSCSQNWSINRMSRVDRNIIRVATFELAFLGEIPPNVSINEAIEVAKKYAADDSPMFVNGVLDKVAATIKENGGIPAHITKRVANG